MTINNSNLIKSDEHWGKFWSEVAKEDERQQSQIISIKKEKMETLAASTLESLPINNNNLERKGDIPQEWRDAIVALTNMQQPKVISSVKWYSLRQVLACLFSQEYLLLKNIITHDWSIADIFGCDKNIPEKSFYNMGLVMLLEETDRVENINDKTIIIRNNRGIITSYSRPYVNARNNQVLIHELS